MKLGKLWLSFFLCRIFLASARTNVNPEKPMDPKESAKQQKLKKELGEKMSGKYINFYSTEVG